VIRNQNFWKLRFLNCFLCFSFDTFCDAFFSILDMYCKVLYNISSTSEVDTKTAYIVLDKVYIWF